MDEQTRAADGLGPSGVTRAAVAVLGRLGLVAGSLVACGLALAAAETVARTWDPDYLAQTRGLHVHSGTYGWALRKGASVVHAGKPVSVNSHGQRGRRVPLQKSLERTRVVLLGDSIGFGLHVADHETFASVLDARDNGIEVVNLSVQGYDPGQELLVLLNEGLHYRPDAVVLAFCVANDFAEPVLPVALYDATPKPWFRLVAGRLVQGERHSGTSVQRGIRVWLSDHSHLFNRLVAQRTGPAPPNWHERYSEAMKDPQYALDLSLALVRHMRSVCRRRGIPFMVAVFPDRASYRVQEPLVSRFMGALQSDGIPAFDFSERFRARGLRMKEVALDGVGHLSPAGHAMVSEELEREVEGWVGPRVVRVARQDARPPTR